MYFEIEQLINSFELGNPGRNRLIIKKLRKYGDKISNFLYEKALKIKDRFLKIQLLVSIGECNDIKLRERIINDAKKETDSFVLATYISLFKRLYFFEAKKIVVDFLIKSEDLRVKANALEFLSETGNEEDITVIKKFLEHENTRVKINAHLAVAKVAERIKGDIVEKLKRLYESDDLTISNGARFALKKLNVPLSKKILNFKSISETLTNNF